MTLYVLLGLATVIVVAIYLARRRRRDSDSSKKVDLPLWDEDAITGGQREFEFGDPPDDTAPAVLSPPERESPERGPDGSRR